jgi:aminocarboxymuconate-semialdehyde decarboxylase
LTASGPTHWRFDQEYATGMRAGRPADRPQVIRCSAAPSAYLKNLYFDTLVYNVANLNFLRRKVGSGQPLLETDFPYVLGDGQRVDKVEALPGSETDKQAIVEGHARKLLKL